MKKISISSILLILSGIVYNQSVQARPAAPILTTITDSVGVEKKEANGLFYTALTKGKRCMPSPDATAVRWPKFGRPTLI
ncbi:hypothetical protein [Spirosoma sp. KNUC1025]|uniref:hypothetical protein n=1 Tax=Spirosoma sp. KNUC1025 TaxID=2894082 RepID=UPI00386DD603|nr:hypothetical protein LN737_29765 [Spirosoma sp. KNUC1025]